MNKTLIIVIDGAIVFTLVWLFNYFVFVKKMKKFKKNDMPLELIYLSYVCDIDPSKVNYHRFQIAYCFINSFIITADYLLVIYLIKSMFMRIILGVVIIVLLIILCYGLLGRYYQRQQSKKSK